MISKSFIHLVFGFVMLLSFSVKAQENTNIDIGHREILRYNNYTLDHISRKVYKTILSKGITAYQDSNLVQSWDPILLTQKLGFCEKIQISRYPNNTQDLVDTFICSPAYEGMFLFASLHNIKDKTSIMFYYKNDKSTKMGYYLLLSEVKNMMNKEERNELEYFTEIGKKYAYNLDSAGMSKLTDSIMLRMSVPIYKAVLQGHLSAYCSDSLNRAIEMNQLKKIGLIYYNAPNGSKKKGTENEVDSLLTRPFNPMDVKGINIVDENKRDVYTTSFNTIAVGPLYIPMINKVMLPIQPIFYLRWDKKAESMLTKRDQDYLKYLISFSRLHKMNPRQYGDMYDFWKGEVGE